jgi:hypothetical protein
LLPIDAAPGFSTPAPTETVLSGRVTYRSIDAKKIVFSPDATIVLLGCNLAGKLNGKPNAEPGLIC